MKFKVIALVLLVFATQLCAAGPDKTSKPDYQALLDAARDARLRYHTNRAQMAAEKARLRYVTDLTEIACRYMDIGKGQAWLKLQDGWEALNREIVLYPAPKDSDAKTLSRLLVGRWESPRHDYIYYKNGKWSMLPIEPDVTHGHWRIVGNQYWDGDVVENGAVAHGTPYTIILLNQKYFVFTNSPESAFFEQRITK
jgi:hypothetical protein